MSPGLNEFQFFSHRILNQGSILFQSINFIGESNPVYLQSVFDQRVQLAEPAKAFEEISIFQPARLKF